MCLSGQNAAKKGFLTDANIKSHMLVLANGNYCPRALVAREGDRLECHPIDLYIDKPDSVFETDVKRTGVLAMNDIDNIFRLEKHVDKPTAVYSDMYKWAKSYIFVERDSQCVVTDRFGVCKLRITDVREDAVVAINLWHGRLGKLTIKQTSKGVAVVNPGLIKVSSEIIKKGKRIDVIVDNEE